MEKIKTPLMTAIENIKSLKALAEKRENGSSWDHRIIQMDNDMKMLESLLPTERDMIEKVWINSQLSNLKSDHYWCDGEYENLEYLAQDYFTQTFESYE